MAKWNSDNILLTLKGREVLSKVQAGVGKMTVSRIVTGGGYVAPSQLYNQTAVKNEKQVANIVSVLTTAEGSSIEVQIDNLNLTAEYDLYQIGIYVTHPDFVGEVLYLIAQCDIADPDRIPLPSDTPVTLGYNLYMSHAGTDQVVIETSLSGLVTVPAFNTYKLEVQTELDKKLDKTAIVFATKSEAEAGTNNTKFMTPLRTKEALNKAMEPFNAHIADKDNPHNVTKSTIGLGSVDNYGTATQLEAEAGTVTNKFMTPLRVKEAINALQAVKSVAGRTGAVTLTKSDVGLTNVDNVQQATKVEFNTHVADTSNPHGVTKAHVGLGSVLNYGIASQAEALAGTSNVKYMTPLRVKEAIDSSAPKLGETEDTAYRGDRGKQAFDHITSTGASHTYINQDVRSTASPTFANVKVTNKLGVGTTAPDESIHTVGKVKADQGVVVGDFIIQHNAVSQSLEFNLI